MSGIYEECPSCMVELSSDCTINQLRKLLEDYDALLLEIAPFTYRDGSKAKTLRERKAELFAEQAE